MNSWSTRSALRRILRSSTHRIWSAPLEQFPGLGCLIHRVHHADQGLGDLNALRLRHLFPINPVLLCHRRYGHHENPHREIAASRSRGPRPDGLPPPASSYHRSETGSLPVFRKALISFTKDVSPGSARRRWGLGEATSVSGDGLRCGRFAARLTKEIPGIPGSVRDHWACRPACAQRLP